MNFVSDNAGPVHPAVMDAIARANEGYAMPYGNDALTERALNKIRNIFEAPDAEVFLMHTGSATNSLLIAAMTRPWDTVFCANYAHIHVDEGNAPEAFSNGIKFTTVGASEDKFNASELSEALQIWDPENPQHPAHGPVSITQVSERGTLYGLDEIRAIADVAKDAGLSLHLDGARFSNAIAALGCSAADMTWRAGVDAVSFGGTKNGLMGVEAAVIFDPAKIPNFVRHRQRAAMRFSKARYLAAQMDAYLTDGLWLETASEANRRAAMLAAGLEGVLDARFAFPVDANMIYVWMPRFRHRALKAAGAGYYIEVGNLDGDDPHELLLGRLVCDWSVSEAKIAQFVDIAETATP